MTSRRREKGKGKLPCGALHEMRVLTCFKPTSNNFLFGLGIVATALSTGSPFAAPGTANAQSVRPRDVASATNVQAGEQYARQLLPSLVDEAANAVDNDVRQNGKPSSSYDFTQLLRQKYNMATDDAQKAAVIAFAEMDGPSLINRYKCCT